MSLEKSRFIRKLLIRKFDSLVEINYKTIERRIIVEGSELLLMYPSNVAHLVPRYFSTLRDLHDLNRRLHTCPSWGRPVDGEDFLEKPCISRSHMHAFLPPTWNGKLKKWECNLVPESGRYDGRLPPVNLMRQNSFRLCQVLKLPEIVRERQMFPPSGDARSSEFSLFSSAYSAENVLRLLSGELRNPPLHRAYFKYFWPHIRKHRSLAPVSAGTRSVRRKRKTCSRTMVAFSHGHRLRSKRVVIKLGKKESTICWRTFQGVLFY